MPDTKVVRAYAPGTKDSRALLAFMSNTDVVFDTDTGQTLRSILANMQSKIDNLETNQGSSTDNYIRNIASSDWVYNDTDKKYHISIAKDEHKLSNIMFTKIMVTDDNDNQIFGYGLLNDVDYTVTQSADDTVDISTSSTFNARVIISSYKNSTEIKFTTDQWTSDSSGKFIFVINHDVHKITNPMVTSLSFIDSDDNYVEAYGVADGYDYNLIIDGESNIKIYTTNAFSGRIVISKI